MDYTHFFWSFWAVAPLYCTSHQQCHEDTTCHINGAHTQCSGFDDQHKNCEIGECTCVRGQHDPRCDNLPNNYDLEDGGWCFDGRRDEHCMTPSIFSYTFFVNI